MKVLTVIAMAISLNLTYAESQNLVGRSRDEVASYMSEKMYDFSLQRYRGSEELSLLRYVDRGERQTILFFFDDKERCLEVRLIFDRAFYREKVSRLDSLYRRIGENEWAETRGEERYSITLSDDQFYYTIRFRRGEVKGTEQKKI